MNKIFLMGRLTRDPEIRYSQGDNPIAIARYSLAVDKKQTRYASRVEPREYRPMHYKRSAWEFFVHTLARA